MSCLVRRLPALFLVTGVAVFAAQAPAVLPLVAVYSDRVANQDPAGSPATPVSVLRYEPAVDLQARNFAEGQADIIIRGGIFENTGMRLGAVSMLDPQTGHYTAELPAPPVMLGGPVIATGLEHAVHALSANVGSIAFGWRPIANAGSASVAFGDHGFNRQEIYGAGLGRGEFAGRKVGVDLSFARSESDGSVRFGDHQFARTVARVQLLGAGSQTDLFAGYQAKFFAWPNLYTPFNSNESENLQTTLFALNHREDLGGGDFLEAGLFHRRNKDDYAFNRFAPVGVVHPFQHTAWSSGAALGGRQNFGSVTLNYRGEVQADELKSTSLTAGPYRTRTMAKFSLVPEGSWNSEAGSRIVLKAGATYDDSNRTGSAVSPVLELSRERPAAALQRIYFSYTETTQLPNYTALNSSAVSGLFRGNPNLRREFSHNSEIGAAGAFAGWEGRAALFYRQDDALVDWTFRRGVTARSANAVDIATTGFETMARRSWKTWDVVLGYSFLAKHADYRGAVVDASFYALNYARHRFTAAVAARVGRNFEVRLDNVARVQADNPLRAVGGDETLISTLGLIYRVPSVRGLEFSAQADNLWNSNFQEVPGVPASRRMISAGVRYAW